LQFLQQLQPLLQQRLQRHGLLQFLYMRRHDYLYFGLCGVRLRADRYGKLQRITFADVARIAGTSFEEQA